MFFSPSNFLVRFRLFKTILYLRFWVSPGGGYVQLLSSGILRHVEVWKFTDVSEGHTASIIVFHSVPIPAYIRCNFPTFVLLFDPEDGGSALPLNTDKILLYCTPEHPRRLHYCFRSIYWGRDSSIGKQQKRNRASIPGIGKICFSLQRQDRLWGPPGPLFNGYRGKAAGALWQSFPDVFFTRCSIN
jgi:hypothetical protein